MNICNANYNIKFMSGENKKITFFYLLDFEMKNFKISFVTELRKQFKDKGIFFDQIKLFDNGDIYNFNYIPEDNHVFDIFIDDVSYNITDDEISYYKNVWKGEEFKTYLVWCQRKDVLKYVIVYCGSGDNLVMSLSFTEEELKIFIKRSKEESEPEWEFVDDISYLRHFYETGKTSIY
jgi:hypothetical protein